MLKIEEDELLALKEVFSLLNTIEVKGMANIVPMYNAMTIIDNIGRAIISRKDDDDSIKVDKK